MTALTPVDRRPARTTPAATLQLLTRLAVAFARRRAYPEPHPLVRTAEAQAYEALTAALAERPTLTFSIGKDELLVGEVPVEGSGDVARDFSERLRQRGIGALTFDRAVSAESLSQAIGWLAVESSSGDGGASRNGPPSLAGVSMARIAYGRLALVDADSSAASSATSIWRALAAVSMLDDADGSDGVGAADRADTSEHDGRGPDRNATGDAATTPPAEDAEAVGPSDPRDVAEAIERRIHREGYARRVAFVLLRVAEEVAQVDSSQRGELGERLRTVLTSLRKDSVGEIIKSVGVGADQRQFISQVIDALPASAIVEWLETAAHATGEDLSHHLLGLMGKLAARTQQGAGAAAESAVRDAARSVVSGWTPDAGRALITEGSVERISRFDVAQAEAPGEDLETARMVYLALEIDAFGDDARESAQRLIEQGAIVSLIRWAADAPGRQAAEALQVMLCAPDAITSVLLREPLDQASARVLLTSLGPEAIPVLLDVLRDAKGRATRRLVYDRLREFGAALTPHLLPRLESAPWYVIRNLLALLRDTAIAEGTTVDAASATLLSFLSHQHEQVRVEVLRLLASEAATRDLALRKALDDGSPRVVDVAIELLSGDDATPRAPMSAELSRRVVRLIDAGVADDERHARLIRALGDAPAAASIRDLLITITTRKTLVLRRVVLADVTPVVIAAVELLARRYTNDARSFAVLELARIHEDQRMRDAASVTATPQRATG